MDKRFRIIDIVVPIIGEPDHFLGILSLLSIPELSWMKNYKVATRVVNHEYEIMLITNREITFADCKSELVSILPYDGPIKLSCRGMLYPAEDLLIKPWQGRGLRNVFISDNSTIRVKGSALLIHYWNKNS
jgi:thiamine pyrophosphokinase